MIRLLAAFVALPLVGFAADVETDLPKETGEKKTSYYHQKGFRTNPFRKGKVEPGNTKIPKSAFKLGKNVIEFTNDSNQGYPICLAYAVLKGLKQ